jgi:hypothetical protein
LQTQHACNNWEKKGKKKGQDVSCKVHAQMGGPIWVSHKIIQHCGCHCNAHVAL